MTLTRRQRIARICAALAFAALMPFAVASAVRLLDPALAETADEFLVWANAVPVALVVLVLWCVSGRALLSAWVGFWLLWALFAVNAVKVDNLQRMLAYSDWALLGQVLGNLGLFWGYLEVSWRGLLAALLVTAATLALCRLEPRTLPRLAWRVPLVALSWLLLASLLGGAGFWRERLDDQRLAGFQIWSPDLSMMRSGLLIGLVRMGWESDVAVPEPSAAERAQVEEFLEHHATAISTLTRRPVPETLPDIVVVQSEALFDPGRMNGFESRDWLAGLHALRERGVGGEIQVPAYGGGTIRTEFEVLTGYPMAAFPGVDYPYYGLTDRPVPSLASWLESLGYRSLVVHPYERSFWNRDSAMRNLGFRESHYEQDVAFRDPDRRGPYVSDDEAFDRTLELVDREAPAFAFLITMENHSPWNNRRNVDAAERDAVALPVDPGEPLATQLKNYLFHLEHGDRALARFAHALLSRPRPTLLLVYGDHLPGLSPVYEKIGFDDGQAPWHQPVPWVMAANFPIRQPKDVGSSFQLGATLLEVAHLPMPPHFAAVNVLSGVADVDVHEPEAGLHMAHALARTAYVEH